MGDDFNEPVEDEEPDEELNSACFEALIMKQHFMYSDYHLLL